MASGNITPEQFKQACSNAIKVVQNNIGNILINATNIGSGELQYRVFNEGKTVAGKKMEYRNAPSNYTNLRQDAGLHINFKDLIFTGNLFYSMTILSTKNDEVVYGFNNAEMAQIAEWQETSDVQVNEPIFELSQKEVNIMETQFARDVTRIFTSALENFPEMPTVKKEKDPKDAINKSIARNQKKKRKQNKSKGVQKLDKSVQALDKSIKAKTNRLEMQKQSLTKSKEKLGSIKEKKQSAQSQLKSNEYRRIDTGKRKDYLEGYIKRKEAHLKSNQDKLARSRKGSKAGAEYLRKVNQQRKELSMAKSALNDVKKVQPLKKQISKSTKQLEKSKNLYKTQSTKAKAYQKKASAKLRAEKAVKRAKQMRMGTYKPTKRVKK